MALIDPNQYIKQLRGLEDKISDGITSFAGNMNFVYFHAVWFGFWISAGLGVFGPDYTFDKYPFGLLTMIVSLEAIFLSTFVMISQNRSSEKSEIRSQLDYETDLQAEREIGIIMRTLVRLADKQGVKIDDLTSEMDNVRNLAKREAEQHVKRRGRRAKQS